MKTTVYNVLLSKLCLYLIFQWCQRQVEDIQVWKRQIWHADFILKNTNSRAAKINYFEWGVINLIK